MIDLSTVFYILAILILSSIVFSFWLIIIWIGLVHSFVYLQEWKRAKANQKHEKFDFFEHVEELKNDFK